MNWFLSLPLVFTLLVVGCTRQSNDFAGYKLIRSQKMELHDSQIVEMEHEKSGATVVLMKNQDPARSFMVGFRTPPYDDTGLFHIFEHSVLEGSRDYPSKSNFFNLVRSSVNSFANAMTGSVYTYYPFVTKSTEDFDNLLGVYMDAVFFPNVTSDPRLVQREGWRYEVDPDTKKMSINGIVLSEMKGAFSSPHRSLYMQLSRALIPDTPYAFSSGGLPAKVATLKFEQIQDAHKKYYHPQNSVIFLYGDLDYDRVLKRIDDKFLSHFEKQPDFKKPEIPLQRDFNYASDVLESTYPGKKGKNKDFVADGFVMGPELSPVDSSILSVLTTAFAESDAGPLRQRILKDGLAKSTYTMGLGGQDNAMAFVFEGTEKENREKIGKALKEEITNVSKNGLDPELLNSILNKYEFSFKEQNANGSLKGYQMANIVLQNWIYQDEPLKDALDFVKHFKEVRSKLNNSSFVKEFFKKHFVKNDKERWVVLTPDPDFSQKFNAGLDKQVEEALKEKPFEDYAKEFAEYQKWVESEEPIEVLKKTPTLQLDQIKGDEKPVAMNITQKDGVEVIQFPLETSGIRYMSLYFDLKGLEEKDLKNLAFLSGYIQRVSTSKTDYKDLSKKLDTYIGALSFSVTDFAKLKTPDDYRPVLKVGASFLVENAEKTMELIHELLTQSEFGPEQHLNNLFEESKTGMISGVSRRAPSLAQSAAAKNFYPNVGAYNDATSGLTFEHYVLKEEIDIAELQKTLKKMRDLIFNQQRLFSMVLVSDDKDLVPFQDSVFALRGRLPTTKTEDNTWTFKEQKNFDGIAIPGEVQYVYQMGSYRKYGLEYSGTLSAYSNFLGNNYMTPKLREQSGAYGAWVKFSQDGLFSFATYKDPNLKSTLDAFKGVVPFMKSTELTQEKILPTLIGSLKPFYEDKSIIDKAGHMVWLHIAGSSWDEYMQLKQDILKTTPEDFNKITEVLEKAMEDTTIAISGNEEKLKKEGNFLKDILKLN